MKRLKKLIYPTLFAAVFLALLLVGYLNQSQVEQLKRQGKPYNLNPVTVVDGERGERGEKGDKGDPPTAEDIRQAVANYCASTGLCEGHAPSQAVVYAAVTSYCTDSRCEGEDGQDGVDGADGAAGRNAPQVTDAEIQRQVQRYCQSNGCTGPKGEAGQAGANGLPGAAGKPGADGRTPMVACVVRTTNSLATKYIAWKYASDPDSAYADLYKLPSWAECTKPVDLK